MVVVLFRRRPDSAGSPLNVNGHEAARYGEECQRDGAGFEPKNYEKPVC